MPCTPDPRRNDTASRLDKKQRLLIIQRIKEKENGTVQ